MNKKWIAVGALVVVFLSGLIVYQFQKDHWIHSKIETSHMAQIKQQSPDGTLKYTEIISKPVKLGKDILYNAIYYPDAQTVICTVSTAGTAGSFDSIQPYLVDKKGRFINGWYLPTSEKYQSLKLIFEHVADVKLLYLDLIDAQVRN